jgi:glycosyltransferase involved in cell wall biosynthesis
MACATSSAQVDAALQRVPAREWPRLLDLLTALETGDTAAYLELLRRDDVSGPLKVAAGMARMRRARAGTDDGDAELRSWVERVRGWMRAAPVTTGPAVPPALASAHATLLPELGDGRFIQLAHETMLGRAAQPHELVRWQQRLERGEVAREGLLDALLEEARRVAERDAARRGEAEPAFHVMGTGRRVTVQDWQARARELAHAPAVPRPASGAPRLRLGGPPRVRISAITSLYAGGEFIERFLENITGQSVFADHAELIVVDAASPDGEGAVIERYRRRWPQIRYLRTLGRIGIYEAWNLAVNMARGDYLTSANVDDLRRHDSLEQQAALLEELPFVDVVYQDFFYTLDPTLGFDEAAAYGFVSDLPLVTPHGLMAMNPPHNAPMWRRSLHDELGLFDTGLQSAGDYDFWMRCVLAGKTFFKLNDPHVVYFQNPRGISTRPDTRGHEETREVHRRYGRQLVSENLVVPVEEFSARCGAPAAPEAPAGAVKQDRQAIVQQALLRRAQAAQGARRASPSVGARSTGPLRLLVDGIGCVEADEVASAWSALASSLLAHPAIEVWWLDRGRAPRVEGLRPVPFPRHRKGACAADSLLIQQVCDLHRVDVFVSTGWTTPVATPTLLVLDRAWDNGTREDPAAHARRERALALAFAQHVVCASEAVQAQLRRHHPERPSASITLAAGDPARGAAPGAAVLAAAVIEGCRELRARSDNDSAAFFAEWRRLRELQASVDF